MEDISRELEREIAQSKPKPYKKDRKSRILIVDDFGKIKSGNYLKKLIKILSVICLICFVATCVYYYLYSVLSEKAEITINKLAIAEKKVGILTREKELLMARVVISGKKLETENENDELKGLAIAAIKDGTSSIPKTPEIKPASPELEVKTKVLLKEEEQKNLKSPDQKNVDELSEVSVGTETQPLIDTKTSHFIKKTISIEKFTVIKDGNNGDLLVRFDIRNISTEPGDVSGRIFTVLKPDDDTENQWLVVPASALKNGRPSETRRGQYFAIAHFKPVKFRIKNEADADFYKKASIFIFNTQGDLIFEDLIDITEAE